MNMHRIQEQDILPLRDKGGEVRVLLSPKTVQSTQLIMGVATVPVGITIKNHVHDYGEECFYVQQGIGQLILNGEEIYDFRPGDALIVPKGVIHSIKNTGNDVIKVIFATAPLAPTARQGHRNFAEVK